MSKQLECLIMAFNKTVAQELTERIMDLQKYEGMQPSKYQQDLINFVLDGKGSGVVQAVAGSGKTTTIMQALNQLRKKHGSQKTGSLIEAKDFTDVVSYGGVIFKAGTTHSICAKGGKKLVNYALYAGKVKRIIMGGKYKVKLGKVTLPPSEGFSKELKGWIKEGVELAYTHLSTAKQDKLIKSLAYQFSDVIAKLVGVLKNCGVGIFKHRPYSANTVKDLYHHYGIEPFLKGDKATVYFQFVEPHIFDFALKVLKESNTFIPIKIKHPVNMNVITVSSVWDFDDMFYLSALYDAPMPEYDFVFLDECQDTNLVTQLLVKRMIGKKGRAIAVGDVAQAIYAFRGADANAMNEFTQAFNATTIPLSLCYRCGSQIITKVNQIFNSMTQTFPYTQIQSLNTAPQGLVFESTNIQSLDSEQIKMLFNNKTGVICRKNAPLMALVTKLFVEGIPVNFLGKNDLGKQFINKFKNFQETFQKGYAFDSNNQSHKYNKYIGSNVLLFKEELEKYRDNEVKALESNGEVDKMTRVYDEIDCLFHLLTLVDQKYGKNGATLDNVTELINNLFSEDALKDAVTLTTVHRSKGLEFHRAIILNYTDAFFPDWVNQEHLYEQECNMAYVALTRAERELIFISS